MIKTTPRIILQRVIIESHHLILLSFVPLELLILDNTCRRMQLATFLSPHYQQPTTIIIPKILIMNFIFPPVDEYYICIYYVHFMKD